MIDPIRKAWAAIAKEFELHSMKLAGLFATFCASIIYYQDLLFTLLALVPLADVPRGITALAVAAIVYLGPRVARNWPQPGLEDNDDEGAA